VKNLPLLIRAFRSAKAITGSDWNLVIAGSGPLENQIPVASDVERVGFLSPVQLAGLMESCGAFCLPSLYDPWGLVIHESAAAGLPLIVSDACGAGDRFLCDGENGFLFRSGDLHQLTRSLVSVMTSSDRDLLRMAVRSHVLSQAVNPTRSASALLSVLDDRHQAPVDRGRFERPASVPIRLAPPRLRLARAMALRRAEAVGEGSSSVRRAR